jgi:hypothetical protein
MSMLSPEQANFIRWVLRFHFHYVRPSRIALEEEIEAEMSGGCEENTPVQTSIGTPICERVRQAKEYNKYLQALISTEQKVILARCALLECEDAPILDRLILARYRDKLTIQGTCALLGMGVSGYYRLEMVALEVMAPHILGKVWTTVQE